MTLKFLLAFFYMVLLSGGAYLLGENNIIPQNWVGVLTLVFFFVAIYLSHITFKQFESSEKSSKPTYKKGKAKVVSQSLVLGQHVTELTLEIKNTGKTDIIRAECEIGNTRRDFKQKRILSNFYDKLLIVGPGALLKYKWIVASSRSAEYEAGKSYFVTIYLEYRGVTKSKIKTSVVAKMATSD